MYMLLNASLVINICSTVAWCRPYPRWYFTIFYFQCFPLAGLRLRFFWYVFPQDRQLLGCFFGRRFLIIPCSFFFCSVLADGSSYSFSLPVCSLHYPSPAQPSLFWPAILTPRYPVSGAPLPLRHVFFWPAILTPRYPVSGASLPLRHVSFWPAILPPRYPVFRCPSPAPPRLFLTGCFDAQVSAFRCPSPAPPHLLLTGYLDTQVSGFPVPFSRSATTLLTGSFDAQVSLFRYPRAFFSLPVFGVLDRLFRRPPFFFFPTQPSLPGYLGGRLALCAALRYACGFYRSAFAVFFWGGSALPPPSCTSGRTLWCRLVHSVSGGPPFLTLFCTAWLTALGALPLISPVSLLCISYTLGDRRSSRLLGVGTRAPRVLPPPSWDLSAIGN